ncbi:MAG: 2-amino-4-hydroxy-6-hydroxymethyldihydropteridine diphosphokinase [Halomonadaceae bacterium]|nr:MAG: 2-amino-4-hydroxy-6-hydroxymethyldihydropteridine diphosphokinase [Halomonadaceae bacterium]
MNPVRAYIGLGSNQGDPLLQLQDALRALAQLPQSQLIAASPVYRSRPQGPQDQPDFLNMAAALDTGLEPLDLLDQLQHIEQVQGRQRLRHWGPRTLDLDLILLDRQVIDLPRLQVPHPQLSQRDFVLQPLLDLDPSLTLPDGTALADLRQRCPDFGLTVLSQL